MNSQRVRKIIVVAEAMTQMATNKPRQLNQ